MTKTIDTLVEDIYALFDKDADLIRHETHSAEYGRNSELTLLDRVGEREGDGQYLRLSNVGSKCQRELWYTVNRPDDREVLSPKVRLKFLYGDSIENLLLSLAKLAGHRVEGEQRSVSLNGVRGHIDAVIDGVLVDVKSASSFSMAKFRDHLTDDNDAFAYLPQLRSYLLATRDEDYITERNVAAFLVMDKVSGELILDKHTFSDEVLEKNAKMVAERSMMVSSPEVFPTRMPTVQDGYKDKKTGELKPNGNEYLDTKCSYCGFKHTCWDNKLRVFMYSGNKPRFFTKVVKEPKVREVSYDEAQDT